MILEKIDSLIAKMNAKNCNHVLCMSFYAFNCIGSNNLFYNIEKLLNSIYIYVFLI